MPIASPPAPSARGLATAPPGRVFLTLLALAALLTCAATSAPGDHFLVLLAAMLLWLALAAVWGLWLLLALLQRAGRRTLRRRWRQWLVAPLVALLVLANVALATPLRVRLALSEPALRTTAAALARGESVPPGRHGLFVLTALEPLPGGAARFEVRGAGFLAVAGFVYSPAGPPASGPGRHEHLNGPWYTWISVWD